MHISSKPSVSPPVNTSPFSAYSKNVKSPANPQVPKLPSGVISISKNGEELSLRPASPHRYNSSTSSRYSNSTKLSKHSRSSTHTSGFSKFIPATELVSFEDIQTFEQEETPEELLEDEFSGLNFEDEPKHWTVYPSLHSNRNSMIGSTTDNPSSASSSPLDQRLSTYCTVNSGNLAQGTLNGFKFVNGGKDELPKTFNVKQEFVGYNEQVYCPRCKENVNFFVKIKNFKQNL